MNKFNEYKHAIICNLCLVVMFLVCTINDLKFAEFLLYILIIGLPIVSWMNKYTNAKKYIVIISSIFFGIATNIIFSTLEYFYVFVMIIATNILYYNLESLLRGNICEK